MSAVEEAVTPSIFDSLKSVKCKIWHFSRIKKWKLFGSNKLNNITSVY